MLFRTVFPTNWKFSAAFFTLRCSRKHNLHIFRWNGKFFEPKKHGRQSHHYFCKSKYQLFFALGMYICIWFSLFVKILFIRKQQIIIRFKSWIRFAPIRLKSSNFLTESNDKMCLFSFGGSTIYKILFNFKKKKRVL